VNGYREGRSPDVLAVADGTPIYTEPDGTSLREPWPAVGAIDTRVPIAIAGAGIIGGVPVRDGTTLDDIAPTLAAAIGFDRPFPNVRSGTAIPGVTGGGAATLVVEIVWKGVGTADLDGHRSDWRYLASMMHRGVGTADGSTGSLPLDPTATITTIGTGGLPMDHGITGSYVRNDKGDVVAAFGEHGPVPVITTLADDLDAPATTELASPFDQRPNVALVATSTQDRGLVGGAWYPGHDHDGFAIADGKDTVAAAERFLADDGTDDAPDVLGVVLQGSVASMDARTKAIVEAADDADADVLVVGNVGMSGRKEFLLGNVPNRVSHLTRRTLVIVNTAQRVEQGRRRRFGR
jgi:nucleotide-binding universal stress UspA family protein